MATTRKTTTKAKTEEAKVENKNTDDSAELIKQLMAQIAEQNEKMAELQKQIAEKPNQNRVTNTVDSKYIPQRIKCINLYNGALNISTEEYGQGRTFSFDKFGDVRLINFTDLTSCVASYPNTFEKGYVYIANSDVVAELNLTDYYEKFHTKDELEIIVKMNEPYHYEIFAGLDEYMQRSFARKIAERMMANEAVDYNLITKIKMECGIDILKIVQDIEDSKKVKEKK